MRKTYLAPMLLCLLLLACYVLACSNSDSPADTANGDGQAADESTTTTLKRTTTTLAPATWEALSPTGDLPAPRLGSSMVHLADGNRLLLFGGYDGSKYMSDLWSYDLATGSWTVLAPAGAVPPARASQATAYDPVAGQLVMFGGYDGSSYMGDAWSYDATNGSWSPLAATGTTPHARYGHSLVYDSDSKKMLLFGGYDGSVQYADTWSYDPATNVWTELKPSGALPPARDSQALAYDPASKVFVLFGGWSTTSMFDDTWAYDPAANVWTPLKPVSGEPAARALHRMVYDESIEKFVMFGGGTSTATFNDAWLFDLATDTWTPLGASGTSPSARAGLAMAYDTSGRQVLLFGGSDGIDVYLNDLWRLRR